LYWTDSRIFGARRELTLMERLNERYQK
jgi:hypothetical protein